MDQISELLKIKDINPTERGKTLTRIEAVKKLNIEDYIKKIMFLYHTGTKIFFDTNITSIMFREGLDTLLYEDYDHEFIKDFVDKCSEYVFRIKDLIEKEEVYTTPNLIQEILRYSSHYKSRLKTYELVFKNKKKSALSLVKEVVRETAAVEISIANTFNDRLNKLFGEGYSRNCYDRFKGEIFKLFNDQKGCYNDKEFLITALFNSKQNPVLIVSRDSDVEGLIDKSVTNIDLLKNLTGKECVYLDRDCISPPYTVACKIFFY